MVGVNKVHNIVKSHALNNNKRFHVLWDLASALKLWTSLLENHNMFNFGYWLYYSLV